MTSSSVHGSTISFTPQLVSSRARLEITRYCMYSLVTVHARLNKLYCARLWLPVVLHTACRLCFLDLEMTSCPTMWPPSPNVQDITLIMHACLQHIYFPSSVWSAQARVRPPIVWSYKSTALPLLIEQRDMVDISSLFCQYFCTRYAPYIMVGASLCSLLSRSKDICFQVFVIQVREM